MSFKSSALEQKFGKPLFECGHIPNGEGDDEILSFNSDQQKGALYDSLPTNEQHQKDTSRLDWYKWTIKSKHKRVEELPIKFRLSGTSVLENWESAQKAHENPLLKKTLALDIYEHNLAQLDVAITNIKVFELPSLFSSPYNEAAYLQHLLVMNLITRLIKISVKNPNPCTVHVCDTHTIPGDIGIFSGTLRELIKKEFGRLEINIRSRKLGTTLRDISDTMSVFEPSSVLIMVKPLNPLRQLLQHIMAKYSEEALPLLIICNEVMVDIPIEKNRIPEESHMDLQSQMYEGDRTSDLVERLFYEHYHPYPFIADVPRVGLIDSNSTAYDSPAVSGLTKDLVMYIRNDVYQAASKKHEWVDVLHPNLEKLPPKLQEKHQNSLNDLCFDDIMKGL